MLAPARAGAQIGRAGGVALGPSLQGMARLEVLDLSQNNLGDDGAVAVGHALSRCTSLTRLLLGSETVVVPDRVLPLSRNAFVPLAVDGVQRTRSDQKALCPCPKASAAAVTCAR